VDGKHSSGKEVSALCCYLRISLQDHELAGRERAIVARERESVPILRLLFPSPHLPPILIILFIWNESLLCHSLQMKSREKAFVRERSSILTNTWWVLA